MRITTSLNVACLFPALVFFASPLFSQDGFEEKKPETFETYLESDDTILKTHPTIAQALETRNTRLAECSDAYVKKLDALMDREKSKADLETMKSLEKAAKNAKEQRLSPCLLFDRLPSKALPLQLELNKNKSKLNKTLIDVLEKEIAAALKQKEMEKARKIEECYFTFFLPEEMEAKFPEMARGGNKIVFLVPEKRKWQDAYDWCRQRNGDLVSIGSEAEQAFLYKYYLKSGGRASVWTGGIRVLDKWYWSDGTTFAYAYWAPGQPGKRQDRLAFGYGAKGSWDDTWSTAEHPSFIQWTLY